MKISRFNLSILESELKGLEEMFPDVRKAIKNWSEPMYRDQDWIASQRYKLEKELTEFREKLAVVYDFMGDRGLADFIPTSIRNEREAARVPFPEEPVQANGSEPRRMEDTIITYGDETPY